jgi:uncharacterized protein
LNDIPIVSDTSVTAITKSSNLFRMKVCGRITGEILARKIVIATGRSSAKALPSLIRHLSIQVLQQAPDLGIRVELPRGASEVFQKAGFDVKLKDDWADANARSFCVCTGGEGVILDYEGRRYADGHFGPSLTDIVNFGIMVRSPNLIGVDTALKFCDAFSAYSRPLSLSDFLARGEKLLQGPSSDKFLPVLQRVSQFVLKLYNAGAIGCGIADCKVLLPSIDRYWPRIPVSSSMETSCEGAYVIGDATGQWRGYLQAMWSGWCASESITAAFGRVSRNSLGVSLDCEPLMSNV